ncbi:spore gernimation protein GerPD [Robertmurraya sp.]|uniref:spore gernimation protein GerPD n=1 Tax=Robertmurraya sp. TaxID=2837525 RepID=UPI0037047ED1
MNVRIRNKKIQVGNVKVGGVGSASLFLIGDAEVITSASVFDTPADSLIYSPKVPFFPVRNEAQEFAEFWKDEDKSC